jgi:hypothetical protein
MVSRRTITIKVHLSKIITPEIWEKAEDKIAEALGQLGLQGEITNSVTGNSTHFGEQKR